MQGAGTAFILEGFMVTATHVTECCTSLADDVKILGESPLYGLTLCDCDHEVGDMFYYHSRREGLKIVYSVEEDDIFIVGEGPMPPLMGESGSPVLCMEHRHVVGLITAILLDAHPDYPGGTLISKITRDMLPKQDD